MDAADQGPLPPGSVIGMLGGGQLGRMAALAAAALGYRTHIFCPETACPASQVTSLSTIASYDDQEALAAFADAVDVITLEFENIPLASAHFLAEHKPLRPGPEILRICQNRVREKDYCAALGIPTARYRAVDDLASLEQAVAEIGRPALLKTTELGYDGKGQVRLEPDSDLGEAWTAIAPGAARAGAVLEGFVPFKLELSVLVARGPDGACVTYPAVENRHRNQILHETHVPGAISALAAERADTIARRLAGALDLVGLLAIEMFVTDQDDVLVNELAPRPHNSGHWTLDACTISQFEQFIRAVCGLPLGATEPLADAVMTNLLGDEANDWLSILAEPNAKLHLYGKAEARPGRKMGHVTRIGPRR